MKKVAVNERRRQLSSHLQEIEEYSYHRAFLTKLQSYSWLPPSEHRAFAERLYENEFRGKDGPPMPTTILAFTLSQMSILRMIWGRAVQPLGKLDDLAPVIGAIRLGGPKKETAEAHVAPLIMNAYFRSRDDEFLSRVDKFIRIPDDKIGDHRNYQVWIAIAEIYNRAKTFTEGNGRALYDQGIPHTICSWNLPNTKEVRAYVFSPANAGAQRFGNLPPEEDGKGWTRVWAQSGANELITKATKSSCKIGLERHWKKLAEG